MLKNVRRGRTLLRQKRTTDRGIPSIKMREEFQLQEGGDAGIEGYEKHNELN